MKGKVKLTPPPEKTTFKKPSHIRVKKIMEMKRRIMEIEKYKKSEITGMDVFPFTFFTKKKLCFVRKHSLGKGSLYHYIGSIVFF